MLIFALKMVQVTSDGNLQNDESNHQNAGNEPISNHQTDENLQKSNHQTDENLQKSNHQKQGGTKLTKRQEDIRNFCSVPRTSQEIMDRIGISNQSKNRQRHIGTLIELGILEPTIPENPKDKNQKYIRTR